MPLSADPPPLNTSDLSITLHKGRSSTTSYPFSNYISYARLYVPHSALATTLDSSYLLKNFLEAALILEWQVVMDEEIATLKSQNIGHLVLPYDADLPL